MNFYNISLVFILLFSISCGKKLADSENSSGTKVLMKIPTSLVKKSNLGGISKACAPGTCSGSWGQEQPSNWAETDCVAIFVEWADAVPAPNECYEYDHTTGGKGALIASPRMVLGLFGKGEEFSIEVPSGDGRKFTVVAFKSLVGCPSIQDLNSAIEANLSFPLEVGSATADLQGGEQVVDITVNLSNGVDIGDCEGPGFNDEQEAKFGSAVFGLDIFAP